MTNWRKVLYWLQRTVWVPVHKWELVQPTVIERAPPVFGVRTGPLTVTEIMEPTNERPVGPPVWRWMYAGWAWRWQTRRGHDGTTRVRR